MKIMKNVGTQNPKKTVAKVARKQKSKSRKNTKNAARRQHQGVAVLLILTMKNWKRNFRKKDSELKKKKGDERKT